MPLRALLEHPGVSVRTAAGSVLALLYGAARKLKAHMKNTGLSLSEIRGNPAPAVDPKGDDGEATKEETGEGQAAEPSEGKKEGDTNVEDEAKEEDMEGEEGWDEVDEWAWDELGDDADAETGDGNEDGESDSDDEGGRRGKKSKAGKGRGAWGSERKAEKWEGEREGKGSWDWREHVAAFKQKVTEADALVVTDVVSSKGVVDSSPKGKVARAAGGTLLGDARELAEEYDLRAVETSLIEQLRVLRTDARRSRSKKDRRHQKAEFRAIEATVTVRW